MKLEDEVPSELINLMNFENLKTHIFNDDLLENTNDKVTNRFQIMESEWKMKYIKKHHNDHYEQLIKIKKLISETIHKNLNIKVQRSIFSLLETKDVFVEPQFIHTDLIYNCDYDKSKCLILLALEDETFVRVIPGSHKFKEIKIIQHKEACCISNYEKVFQFNKGEIS